MNDFTVLSFVDSNYPKLLIEIPDPPKQLYVRGIIPNGKYIAVVGTRHPTAYGIEMTKRIVPELVKQGFVIVSGLAIGIDTVAHETAITVGGKTVAVLGAGIDIIWPPSNTDLYWQIIKGKGAIISEHACGVRTTKEQFKTRNRIISGLSLGVVVIEGTNHSGTLVTAKYAAEQGREVFAVPGPVTSRNSAAASILLKNGAKLVESAGDIIEEFE